VARWWSNRPQMGCTFDARSPKINRSADSVIVIVTQFPGNAFPK
jgi:hypothetical protein